MIIKQFRKAKIVFLVAISMLLSTTQCIIGPKQIPLDFQPTGNFHLDASSHELEVRARQLNYFEMEFINHLTINGVAEYPQSLIGENWKVSVGSLANERDTVMHFDNLTLVCRSHYIMRYNLTVWKIVEIHGEWFSIKPTDDGNAMSVSIAENNENAERILRIHFVLGEMWGNVIIRQRGR